MKKKVGRVVSYLLCLSLLLSIVAPAAATAVGEDQAPEEILSQDGQDGSQGADDGIQGEEPSPDESSDAIEPASNEPAAQAADGEYEIYPTPHSVTYGSSTVTLPDTLQVVYESGIDQYTKDRADEAFAQAGVTLSEAAVAGGTMTLRVGVKGSGGAVDTYFADHAPVTTGLYDKYDAYQLIIDADGVAVLGKDTDAAFYGLTTVKHILIQSGKTVRALTVEDYADVQFRGFIEGYYGNPWTVEDRAALMEYGGELKMNIYFYAPKDDPKHSTNWRELYTEEELETKIRPLAEAGNKSKCYYGYALHPFWADGINYSDDTQYAADLEVLKAKFEQVIKVGVRQIAVLADDRGVPAIGVEGSYVRLMTDLTEWVSSDEMQAKYPGLKISIPFCPNDYMGNGSSQQIRDLCEKLPATVPVIMTGGTIWGQVSHSFLSTYRSNTNSGTFMWVNWPCSDKSKGSLTMGAHDIILHSDLTEDDIATLKGIMLNPMQQSEPSKQAIFCNADYAWNIWNGDDHEERTTNAWNDSFKYVDHNNALETDASAALRELSKHMIHQNGSVGWHQDYPESVELAPVLAAFRDKLAAGTVTQADIANVRSEFVKLNEAAILYKNKTTGNMRILGQRTANGYVDAQEQMAPWLDCWEEFTQANLDLLDAMNLIVTNDSVGKNNSQIVAKYLSGQEQLAASESHKFWYIDHDEYAMVGGMHIVPFTNELLSTVALSAKLIVDPTAIIATPITSRTDTPAGGLDAMLDGNPATEAVFKNPNSISVGDYVGVKYSRAIPVTYVRFDVGTASNANDTFNGSKLQYLDENDEWQDIPGAVFTHSDLVLEASGLNLTAKGIRVVATEARTNTWLGIKEIYVNKQPGGSSSTDGEGKLSGTIIRTSRWTVYSGSEGNLTDGDDSTNVWYNVQNSDYTEVGEYIGMDLGAVQKVGRVRFVVGSSGSSDKWTNYTLQYSVDNSTWTDVKTYSSTANMDVVDEDLGGVEARYVRLVNGTRLHAWIKFSEIAIYVAESARNDIEKIAYQSSAVEQLTNPVGRLTDNSASLSAESITLRSGQFVGIILPRIRDIEEVVVTYGVGGAPSGVVLEVGANENEMQVVDLNARMAYSGNARYIRLRNTSNSQVTFELRELSVRSDEVSGIQFLESNIPTTSVYYNSDDARAKGTTGNWFDGNLSTIATYASEHTEGHYVTYDLGQDREIRKIDAVISDSVTNYVRTGKIQVSLDGENWTDVVDITTTATDAAGGFNTTPLGAGWESPYPGNPNFAYQTGSIQPEMARYLRLYITQTYEDSRFPALGEVVINDGEYVPTVNDPTFEANPIEQQGFEPARMMDGDLTTGFRPNMDGRTEGSIIYRLSDNTAVGQINVLVSANSGIQVSVRTGADAWHDLGSPLTESMTTVTVPDQYRNVYEIKLSWGNTTPTIYELICVERDTSVSGNQAASEVETVPVNSYSGADGSILFDENWKFNLGDASGAQATVYNDSGWRSVNLPHDYSIEQDYTSAGEAESGYLPGGIGWYRKSFTVSPAWEGKTVTIDFGGVYMDTEVYLNGEKLGEHHYGYTPFSFVLPGDKLNYEGENVIAVRVNNPVPTSRWYSGSGIYRSVYLTVSDPVHVAQYGTYVTTTNAGAVTVKTNVQNDGSAAANVTVRSEIFELDGVTFQAKGTAVATNDSTAASVAASGTNEFSQTLNVTSPKLWNSWDKGEPNLYVLKTTVLVNGTAVDTHETEFGFREINFNAASGFQLNGENLKLKGVCMHHDQGALGSEAWYRALERQVEILMEMGCNSIRVTHNPAANELIEICNRKGMLIIDEAFDGWTKAKNGNSGDFARWFNVQIASDNALVGKKDNETWAQFVLETMVNRDKNAPSVIMYSLGNEVQEGTSGYDSTFVTTANNLIQWTQAIDTTRPVTRGSNGRSTGSDYDGQINALIAEAGGIVGFNYVNESQITAGYNKGWLMYASETASAVNSRGIYNIKGSQALNSDKRLTSYDKSAVGWGARASDAWWRTIRYDYNAGEYVWTGFDYIGEPTPNNGTGTGWANGEDSPKNSFFGIIDTNGIPKDSYYLYRAMWNDTDTTLHVLPTWDRADLMISGGKAEVVVYSNAPMVKVLLNGEVVGTATSTLHTTDAKHTYRTFDTGDGAFASASGHQSLYATFNVTYEEGTLEVKAFQADGVTEITDTVGRDVVKTTTGASKLVAEADRTSIKNDGRDLSYITIDVTDASGEIVNGAEPEIRVSVSGDGVLMGLDNGVQPDHTSYLSNTRKAGAGRLVAIVQSTKTEGSFTVTATSSGLAPASVTVSTGGVVSTVDPDTVVSYDISKTYYVQRYTAPVLPEEVTVTLANGTRQTKSVTWNSYDASLLDTVGSEFAITGVIDAGGLNISTSVGVVVVDRVVALLNYSTAIQVGGTPVLPATRPAVIADGSVLTAQFPVTWTMPNASAFSEAGTVEITGTASAFGTDFSVTAWVRVSEGSVVEGGNVSSAAVRPTLNGESNADVGKIYDNDLSTVWTGSGATAVTFDTAQNFYRIKLTYSGAAPTTGVTLTLDGVAVDVQPVISGSTATYELGRIHSATDLGITFADEVSLAEAELIVGTPVFDEYSTAVLDDLKLSGESASTAALAAHEVRTSSARAMIEPVSESNVAYTILPQDGDTVIIVTESEDNSARDLYTVILNSSEVSASDDSRDYPYTKTTATAPSQQLPADKNVEGPVEFAVDNNENTYWHSDWDENLVNQAEKRYIQLELEEETEIVAFRYKPRPTMANGIVTKYRIEVSTDGETYTTVATGDWEHNTVWKIATFDMVSAKYVRLYGVETKGGSGDTPNKFMSAAEIRVVMAETGEDLSTATVTVSPTSFAWTGDPIEPENITVTLPDGTVVPSEDYTVEYDHNVDAGTAYVYIHAAEGSDYRGIGWGTFTIYKSSAEVVSIESEVRRVKEGTVPNLATLVPQVQVYLSDGVSEWRDVTWDAVSDSQFINPTEKSFTIGGDVEGTTIRASLRIDLVYAQSVGGVSFVTAQGVAPVLPSTVLVQFEDATSEERPVTWNLTGVNFDTVGMVEVTGTVSNISRVTATASVRVVAAVPGTTNIALNENGTGIPFAMAYVSSPADNPYRVIDGIRTGDSSGSKQIWCDWESGVFHEAPWVGVALAGSLEGSDETAMTYVAGTRLVNKVRIAFLEEDAGNSSSKVSLPADYKVQYYTGDLSDLVFNTHKTVTGQRTGNGFVRDWTNSPLNDDANWTDVTTVGIKPAVPADTATAHSTWVEYEFEPVQASIIRLVLTPKASQWVGVEELEIYGLELPEPYDDFEVTSVKIDGQERLDAFTQVDENNFRMEMELDRNQAIPQLSAEATNNASIVIQQASQPYEAATVTITSEDGSKTVVYTVQFTLAGAEEHTVNLPSNGKVHADITTSVAGATITLTVDEGYELTIQRLAHVGTNEPVDYVQVDAGTVTFIMPDADVNVVAKVTPATYSISYDLKGGSDGGRNKTSYTIETPSFRLKNPTRDGYVFAGWLKDGYDEVSKSMIVRKGTMGDLKFVATWTEIKNEPETNVIPGGAPSTPVDSSTTTDENGNKVVTTVNKNTGTTTVTTTAPDGVVTAVTTTTDGRTSVEATVPKNNPGTVELTMPELKPGETVADAPSVTLINNGSTPVSVVIPVSGGNTVVAVRINDDGTETLVPMSVVDENGLRVKVNGTVNFRIIDNKKNYTDIPEGYWGEDAVDFVTSRGLFVGMNQPDVFAPDKIINRAMMVTVLWRLAEKPESSTEINFSDVTAGAYYRDALSWALERGVVMGTGSGFDPNGSITREMLAVLLYRAAGSPKVVDELPRRFTDIDQVSDWAEAAMIWAIENDILNGRSATRLAPKDVATRAEAAAMLQRFVNKQV